MQSQRKCLAFVIVFGALFALAAAAEAAADPVADLWHSEQAELPIASVARLDLEDEDRNKTIQLRVTYSTEGGPWPVIVWCHGALGSKDNYQPLVKYWAARGYVVIQPTFGDSLTLMTREQKRRLRTPRRAVNSPEVLGQWDDRPVDVAHVLDSLKWIEQQIEPLRDRMDHERIGVGGHSFGAHTSMLIAGLDTKARRLIRKDSFRDDRPDAFVILSPQGPDRTVTAEAYRKLDRPILMVTGDKDASPIEGRTEKAGKWRKQAYDHAPAGERYLLWINDATHNFGGISGSRYRGSGAANSTHLAMVQLGTQALWDAYLKDDEKAEAFLARTEPLGNVGHFENKLDEQ